MARALHFSGAMSARTIGDAHNPRLVPYSPQAQRLPDAADAHLAIKELEALRLKIDGVASPERATNAEPLVAFYRAEMTTGDELRLPLPGNHGGKSIRSALQRMLLADAEAPFLDREAVSKDSRMRALLRAFQGATVVARGFKK